MGGAQDLPNIKWGGGITARASKKKNKEVEKQGLTALHWHHSRDKHYTNPKTSSGVKKRGQKKRKGQE